MVTALSASATAAAPQGRGYELVSPPEKNGGDIMAFSARTRASASGDLISYASLTGFADVRGTGIPVEYLAQRRTGGWATHAITPKVGNNTLKGATAGIDVFYDGAFSPDFTRGIVVSGRPVIDDPWVNGAVNLYRRSDLTSQGAGQYDLLSACPLCAETRTPLPPTPGIANTATWMLPALVGASPDMEHVVFESVLNLTPDAPAQPGLCGTVNPLFPPPAPTFCRPHLYEWDHGQVRLAGVLPDGRAADASFGGTGARNLVLTPHTVSDGSDGHSRIFFTQPADGSGTTVDQFDPTTPQGQFGQLSLLALTLAEAGNLFMRLDHSQTFQLNASERDQADVYSPAQYLDASSDGRRVFFMTSEALTNDAEPGGVKIYMYDASLPDSDPHNLTLITRDEESQDGAEARGLVGVSTDGRYVYMVVTGQLVSGGALNETRVFLWHDGEITDISRVSVGSSLSELLAGGPSSYKNFLRQARVTPDGRHLLFTSVESITPYDQGACESAAGFECREVFVYSAKDDELSCASCNPSGAPATAMASVAVSEIKGGARVTGNENRGITDDGAHVFFSSAEALVPQDTNNKSDAYVYEPATRRVALLSSGTSADDSWFVDASASGGDAFFVTREQLVGWDRDNSYDLYDARVGGGFPEPAPVPPGCGPGACQGSLSAPPAAAGSASATFSGAGDARGVLRHRKPKCKRRAASRASRRASRRGRKQCKAPRKRQRAGHRQSKPSARGVRRAS